MNKNYLFREIFQLLLILLFVLPPLSAFAQRQGLYLPGFAGMNSALVPPPGVYMQAIYMNYLFNGVQNQNGDKLFPNLNGSMNGIAGVFSWVSPYRVLKAHYATDIAVFGLSPNLDFADINVRGNDVGFSDIYFEPLVLMWGGPLSRYGLIFSYGFYAPTGHFVPGAPDNFGKGTWTHQLNVGSTVFLDKQHTWSITNWLHGEIHQKTKDLDLTIGDNLTWEWAIGKTFIHLIDLAAVGYGEWQLSDDHGSAEILPGFHDRVYGVGGELGFQMPRIRSRLAIRGYGEFGARLRTQGHSIFLTLSSALWNNPMPVHSK